MKNVYKLTLSIILICTLMFCLSACGKSIQLTIKKDGNIIEETTTSEFLKKHKSATDGHDLNYGFVDYFEEYLNATISGVGTITSIEKVNSTISDMYGNVLIEYYITVDDSVVLVINENSYIDCNIGDKISFTENYWGVDYKKGYIYLDNRLTETKYIAYEIQ